MLLSDSADQEGSQCLEEVAGEQRREIRCGKRLGAENCAAEGDGGERRTVVVVVAGAVAADEQLRLAIEVDQRRRDRGPQIRQAGSPMVSVLSRSTVSVLAAASMSGSTACQVSPSSEVHRAGTATSPISVRPEPPATPAKTTAPMEIPDSGVKWVECCFGGVGGVHHADAGHRHDDLLAAQCAEVEVMPVDDHGGVRVERGAGENGVGFGGKGGQDQRALSRVATLASADNGLTRRSAAAGGRK